MSYVTYRDYRSYGHTRFVAFMLGSDLSWVRRLIFGALLLICLYLGWILGNIT